MSNESLSTILSTINQTNAEYSKEDIQILNFLKMVDEKKDISDITKPTSLHISTRSAKCKLTNKINMMEAIPIIKNIVDNGLSDTIVGLESGNVAVGQIKRRKKRQTGTLQRKKFYNQVTVIIRAKKDSKNINVKFFLNGSISMTGCDAEDDGIKVMKNFINEIKKYEQVFYEKAHRKTMDIYDYAITLINTDYTIGFKIERAQLYQLLIENYKIYVSYDPSIYQGVKISYMWNKDNPYKDGICRCVNKCRLEKNLRKKNTCKIVTIAIFQSGNIIITGAFCSQTNNGGI